MTAKPNGELIIKKVQFSDGGTYECRGLEYARYYTIYVNGTVGQLTFTNGQSSLVIKPVHMCLSVNVYHHVC